MLRSFVLFLFATFALTAIAIPTESNTNTHGDLKSTLGKRQTTTASRPGPTANSVVGGYYGDWDVYAKKWFPQDLPLESLTHLFYAFAFLTTDGDVQVGDVADIPSTSTTSLGPYPIQTQLLATSSLAGDVEPTYKPKKSDNTLSPLGNLGWLKANKKNTKIMLSIGGYSWSSSFSTVLADKDKTQVFISSIISFLKEWDMDGVDIDWEYPNTDSATLAALGNGDDDNFLSFLTDLSGHEEMQDKLISLAISAGPTIMDQAYKAGIIDYVDFINVMTYDWTGTWDGTKDHNSPLTGVNSVTTAIDHLINTLEFPPNKLVVGVPAYGYILNCPEAATGTTCNKHVGIAGTWDTVGSKYQYNNTLDYAHVKANYITDQDWTAGWDDTLKASYMSNGDKWISYESVDAVTAKKEYVASNGLGGLFMYELEGDREGELLAAMSASSTSTKSSVTSAASQVETSSPASVGSAVSSNIVASAVAHVTATSSPSSAASAVSSDIASTPSTGTGCSTSDSTTTTGGCCTEGKYQCYGTTMEQCVNDDWVDVGMTCGTTCDSTVTSSLWQCSGASLQQCANGVWQSMGDVCDA